MGLSSIQQLLKLFVIGKRHTFPLISGRSFEGEGEMLGESSRNNSTIHVKEYKSDLELGIFIFKISMQIH